jgi:hypothetical protein
MTSISTICIKAGDAIMLRKYFINNIALLSLVFLLFGCATAKTYHMYDGNPLSPSEIATIKPWHETRFIPLASLNVWPGSIDGKVTEPYEGALPSYYVLPGEHKIKIQFFFYDGSHKLRGGDPKEMLFTAESGHLYLTKTNMPKEIAEGEVKISFWIEDANTKKVVAGTRLATEE